jgi:hypothetical protein
MGIKGTGGRNRKPLEVKKVQGNPGRRPLNENRPEPPAGPLGCPEWMSEEEANIWGPDISQLRAWGHQARGQRDPGGLCRAGLDKTAGYAGIETNGHRQPQAGWDHSVFNH